MNVSLCLDTAERTLLCTDLCKKQHFGFNERVLFDSLFFPLRMEKNRRLLAEIISYTVVLGRVH